MKKLPLLALLFLAACYATAQPMYLPDGSAGYRISCDADYLGKPADCIQKAGEMCGANGYQMYDANGHLRSEENQNQAVIAALNGSADSGKSGKPAATDAAFKNMFIKCRSNEMPLHLTPAANPAPVESNINAAPTLQTPTLQTPQPPSTLGKPIPLQNGGK